MAPFTPIPLRRALLAVPILCVVANSHALSADFSPQAVEKTVVHLSGDGVTGTGFLIADERGVCLITAWHIAQHLNAESTVTLLVGDTPQTKALLQLSLAGSLDWARTREPADIAALKLASPTATKPLHVFSRAQISTDIPPRDRPVVATGFPLSIGLSEFEPVSQTYVPASGTVEARSDTFPQPASYYILDRPSIDGLSGAPVFHTPSVFVRGEALVKVRNYSLVGMMAGTISDKTGGKLAVVVPPQFVAEVFDNAFANATE